MASGTRLARMKILEDDGVSNPKTKRLDKINAPSPLRKNPERKQKRVHESHLRKSIRTDRVESSSTNTNSKKHASPIISKNGKANGNIGHSSTPDKAKMSASLQTKKRKVNNKSASSSTEDSTANASPQSKKRKANNRSISSSTEDSAASASSPRKKRKANEKGIILGGGDTKEDSSGKKTIKNHVHVRTYKKMVKKQETKCGSRGVNISKEKEGGDMENKKEDAHDEGNPSAKTMEPLEKEDLKKTKPLSSNLDSPSIRDDAKHDRGAKPGGFKDRKRILNDILVESSGKEMLQSEGCALNKESNSPILKDLGASDNGVCNEECPGFNGNSDFKECSIHSQTAAICSVCEQSGQLVSCYGKGCKRCYHPSCLDPLLPGAWLCKFCVKRKLESGVYSVSDGIESVWDLDEGAQSGKRYFVKYKGLSHSHNRWIPESQLLYDAPSLLAKFRKKGQKEKAPKWRKEWAEPERLLLKRSVELPEASNEHASGSVTKVSNCCIEWFVKWKGLEYDQATWELEKSLFLASPKATGLVEDYEHHREQAKRLYDPLKHEKVISVKKDPFYKLKELPDGCPSDLGSDILGSLNCLREFWHKSVNAVLIDDQERITKSILFVLSMQCYACRPTLIITTSGSLSLWQAGFCRVAPSLNLISYQGDKDVRKMIRNLEFYEESGCLMFQVLLADHEAIIEDIDDISCVGWDVLIIDKCQNSKMSKCLEPLTCLSTDFKLVLFNGQLKDSLPEYCVLLSFLDGGVVEEGFAVLNTDGNEASGALATLKEKLSHHIAYERKADSSNFIEYWVPVPLSNVQLEQYCATLISNSNVLRSNSRSDVVGALHSILITTRKCCDHPYLVDGELRSLLTKGLQSSEFLNAEVRASGKLFLLDRILQEMKNHGLRVVILFQSLGGPGNISLGDILDDFLQQRFGVDSYERIESGLVSTKKAAALKMFNDKGSGRFVFLIEKRACLPSVKLRFVDAVILFDSDWNPLNDLRSLQKISLESPHNCIKVFRLYTSFTVEERILIFGKQDTVIEGNVETISRNISLSLLGWGASYLFRKLDQFHSSSGTTCVSEPSFDKLCLNNVISEILAEFPGKVETDKTAHSIVMKAQQSGSSYSGDVLLVGEKEEISLPDKDMPFFWVGLLDGRHRRWVHIADRTQRIRKKVQNFDGFAKSEAESNEAKKKRRKINVVDAATPVSPQQSSQEKRDSSSKDAYKSAIVKVEVEEPKLEEQKNLLKLLRPELSELCDILGLPASVEARAQEFLTYIMNNHDVCSKQVTVLQALKISLCWRAASMSRHGLDRIESLAIAKKHLNFECSEEEAYSVYLRLRILKEKFPCEEGVSDNSMACNSLNNQSPTMKTMDPKRKVPPGRDKEIVASASKTSALRSPDGSKSSEQISPNQARRIRATSVKFQRNFSTPEGKLLENLINSIEKVSLKRSEDLLRKHRAEVLNFEKQMSEERVQLEKAHSLNLEFVRSIHIDLDVINGKIKMLTREFLLKMGRFFRHFKQQKEKLLSMQLDARIKEQELRHGWLMKAKTGQLEEFFDRVPLLETKFLVEKFKEASNFTSNCASNENSAITNEATKNELAKTPSIESSEPEECRRKVAPNNFSGIAEKSRLSVEAWGSQGPIDNQTPQLEVLNENNGRKQADMIEDSIMLTTIEAGKEEGRDDSNVLPLRTSPGLKQGYLLSSAPGLESSGTASTSSSVQEYMTNEQGSPAVTCTSENDLPLDCSHKSAIPLPNPIASLPPPADQLLSLKHQSASSLAPSSSFEQTRAPPQQSAMAPLNFRSPSLAVHSIRPRDLLSEQTSFINAQETGGIHQVADGAESLSASQHTVVVGQPDHGNQFFPNFRSASWVPTQAFYADLFQNELFRIRKQNDTCAKKLEDKKVQLQLEREAELDKVKMKYDALLQDAEREHHHDRKMLQAVYDKVFWQKVFAEEIRSKFYDHKDGASTHLPLQGPISHLSQQLQPSLPQSQLSFRPSSLPPSIPASITSTLNQELTAPPSLPAAAKPRTRFPIFTSSSQPSSIFPSSNIVRGSAPRTSLHVGRSPAPHLQRFRTNAPAPAPPTVPQSLSAGPFSIPIPPDLGAALPGVSQPSTSGPFSLFCSSSPADELTQDVGVVLLESLLSNLPAMSNEVPASSVNDSRPNESDIIFLSDEE